MASKEEIDFMYSIASELSELDGGSTKLKNSPTFEDVSQMRHLAESLQELADSNDAQLRRIQPKTFVTETIPSKVQFVVAEEAALGTKSIKEYKVQIKETSQVIIRGIYLKECALVVCDFLNTGKSLADVKVLGVIGSALQYTKTITEVYNVSKSRQMVLRESQYDKAKEYDVELSKLQEDAKNIKEKVLKFIKEQNYL